MSRQRKRDAVLRLLRGEDLETVSRSLGVTAATLTSWRDSFLAAGEAALATRPTDGETLESERLKARLGDMLLKHELLEQKITSLEGGRPLYGGGRSDEPHDLPVQRPILWSRSGLPRLADRARNRLSPPGSATDRTGAAARPGRADAGSGVARRDPRRPRREPIPRRRPPQDLGEVTYCWGADLEAPGATIDARE